MSEHRWNIEAPEGMERIPEGEWIPKGAVGWCENGGYITLSGGYAFDSLSPDYLAAFRPISKSKESEYTEAKPTGTPTERIAATCNEIRDMLLEKNQAYGNSALDPVRIFSKADATEQIRVRLDDKLSRIMRGNEYPGEDTTRDLIGYLILMLISEEQQ